MLKIKTEEKIIFPIKSKLTLMFKSHQKMRQNNSASNATDKEQIINKKKNIIN